jgi:hypothetical protein
MATFVGHAANAAPHHTERCCPPDELHGLLLSLLKEEEIMESVTPRRNFKLFGELHPNSKLTREQVIEIRKAIRVPGTSRAWLAKRHGVSRTTIDNIVRGFTWREAM